MKEAVNKLFLRVVFKGWIKTQLVKSEEGIRKDIIQLIVIGADYKLDEDLVSCIEALPTLIFGDLLYLKLSCYPQNSLLGRVYKEAISRPRILLAA